MVIYLICAIISFLLGLFVKDYLLKIVVAYRFAYDNSSSNTHSGEAREVADSEEFILIREMVKIIIKRYNFLRKELNMSYIAKELDTGTFENIRLDE